MKKLFTIFATLSILLAPKILLADELLVSSPVLTLAGAKVIAAAAAQKAKAENWQVVIVVSDAAGNMKYLERMENVQLASLDIAINKAKTAVLYRRPTQVFSDKLKSGVTAMASLPEMIPFGGGVPIKVNGKVIGGVGVSGVKSSQDAQIAQAGIDALLTQLPD